MMIIKKFDLVEQTYNEGIKVSKRKFQMIFVCL